MSWKVLAVSVPTALQVVWKSLEQIAEELNAQCLGFQAAGWLLKLTDGQNWLVGVWGPSIPAFSYFVLA